jgi:fatty acid desaturase
MAVAEVIGEGNARSSAAPVAAAVNLSLAGLQILANLYQFFFLPLVLLPSSHWWALSLLPLAALNNPFWSLLHEAIHDLFHPSRRFNRLAGRALAVFFGSPFLILRLSHLLHHKLNRSAVEATELYAPEKISRARASLGYFAHILGGLYLLELASPLLFFLPKTILRRLERKYFSGADLPGNLMRGLMRDEAIREMRVDGLATLALLAASAASYGVNWPWLAGVLLARAFLISFLDNVYHYGTPVDDTFYARNLSLPRLFSIGLLHFNLHGIHHKNPAIPWAGLRAAFRREAGVFEGNYFIAALSQFYGPLSRAQLPTRGRS